MSSPGSRTCLKATLLALALTTAAATAPKAVAPAGASAAGAPSCRASAVRVGSLEPFVANARGAPCASDAVSLVWPIAVGGLVTLDAVSASTEPAAGAAAGAAATARVTKLTIGLPAPLGLSIAADVLEATASQACTDGEPEPSSSGTVTRLRVMGVTVTVPARDNFTITTRQVPLLPTGVTLVLNQVTTEPDGALVRRALYLKALTTTIVVAEARAAAPAATCPPEGAVPDTDPGTPPGGTDPGPGPGSQPGPRPKPGSGNAPETARGGRARSPRRGPSGRAALIVTPPAAARAIRAGRCVAGAFRAAVTGRRIARVVFALDGRPLKADGRAPFDVRVRTVPGRHRLIARVTFAPASGTRPRTLTLRFTRCSPAPTFTG